MFRAVVTQLTVRFQLNDETVVCELMAPLNAIFQLLAALFIHFQHAYRHAADFDKKHQEIVIKVVCFVQTELKFLLCNVWVVRSFLYVRVQHLHKLYSYQFSVYHRAL